MIRTERAGDIMVVKVFDKAIYTRVGACASALGGLYCRVGHCYKLWRFKWVR